MASSNMMTPESSTMLSGPVGILWDIENCCVPRDVNPEDVAGNIRMALRVHPVITGAVKSFSAFGDFSGFRRELREGCQRTGVKLVDVPNGRKDAADKAILIDMFLFALDNPPPSSILLISGDVDFAPALHILGQRGYTVILVIPAGVNVSSALTNAGRFVWDWPSVARGEGFMPPKFPIPSVPSLVKNVKGREEDIPVDIRVCRNASSSSDGFSDEKKIEMVENYGSSGTMDCQTQKEQTFPQNPERSNLYQKTQNPYQNPISKNSGTSPENSNSQSAKIKPRSQKYRNLTTKLKSLLKTRRPKSNSNPIKIKSLRKNPTPKSNPSPMKIKTSPKNPTPKSNPNPKKIKTLPKNPTPKSNRNPKKIETLPTNPTPKSNPNPQKHKNFTAKTQTPNQPKTQKYQNFPETKKDQTFTKETTKIPKTETKTPILNVVKQKQHLENKDKLKEKGKEKGVSGSGRCSGDVGCGGGGKTLETRRDRQTQREGFGRKEKNKNKTKVTGSRKRGADELFKNRIKQARIEHFATLPTFITTRNNVNIPTFEALNASTQPDGMTVAATDPTAGELAEIHQFARLKELAHEKERRAAEEATETTERVRIFEETRYLPRKRRWFLGSFDLLLFLTILQPFWGAL